jgi:glucose/arabinose dehydrogenase
MTFNRAATVAALVFGTVLGVQGFVTQAPPAAPQMPPPAAPQGERGTAATGRGGGRGNAAATQFTEICAGCHGMDAAGGRAPSLFDDQWARGSDDESLVRHIENGIPGTEMPPFKGALTETQIWELVAYIRTRGATLKGRPAFVADPDNQVIKSEKQTFKIEIVARGIETPWGLAFLPDGRLLVTERPGRLRIIDKGQVLPAVTGLPKVWEKQDGGMFDVEVHPQYARNGWIYLAYSETLPGYTAAPAQPAPPQEGRGRGGPPDPPSMTVIVRGKISSGNEWTEQQVLFRAAPDLYSSNNSHYGLRFIFDTQGHLFYSLGEKGHIPHSQDLASPLGKIHRVNDDGSVPKDNPFVNKPGVPATIWSYGHRNPQGLSWDPVTGKLWESEHGPQGGDEINIIEPGRNYGWGVITSGIQQGITKRAQEGMESPIVYFTPSIGPSGIVFYSGTRYPGWKNNLFVSGLVGQQLRRLEVANGAVTHQEVLFNQYGRVHDVVQGPDGYLYVTLQVPGQPMSASTPGMIARLIPLPTP